MHNRGWLLGFAGSVAVVMAGCGTDHGHVMVDASDFDDAAQKDSGNGGGPDGSVDGNVSVGDGGDNGEFPSPTNTGWEPTGVTLSPYTGPSTITTDNTVIDSKDITDCLVIDAKNVTIKRSRIKCSSWWGIRQMEGATGLLVEDTEVTSTATTNMDTMVDRAIQLDGGSATVRRVYMHATVRGIYLGSDNLTVEDSYYGENHNPGDAHTTGIVSFGGANHVVIRHNTLRAREVATAALALERDYGVSDDYLIDGNLLSTDGSYCFYAGASNLVFKNNKFSTEYEENCGIYGVATDWEPSRGGLVWENNTWYDPGGDKDGQQVPEP